MASITFEDGFNQTITASPPSAIDHYLYGSPDLQENEEGTMFTDQTTAHINHSSATNTEKVDALLSLIDYSDLCMDREFRKNRGVHSDDFMKEKIELYNIKRRDLPFFRNNSVLNESRLYSLCDHLALNHDVLLQVLDVFYEQGPKDLILHTIRGRLSQKKLSTSNSSKTQLHPSSTVNDKGLKFLLPCMSVSLRSLSCAHHGMCCAARNSITSEAGIGGSRKSNRSSVSQVYAGRHHKDQTEEVEENEYELKRKQNITRNAEILEGMGLLQALR